MGRGTTSVARRELLVALAGVSGGCATFGRPSTMGEDSMSSESGPSAGEGGKATEPQGAVDLPVPASELERAVPRDFIPAITDPAFAPDWTDVQLTIRDLEGERTIRPRLSDDDTVVSVERGGTTKAYPLRVLDWFEVVNDRLAGPLMVTYCPLCHSAVVARRTVGERTATFGVSGLLWRQNLVLYDRRTESLWSQLLATAIRGPKTGDELELLPSTVTTWGAWRESHPSGIVLLPPPYSNTVDGTVRRDYTTDPYGEYQRGIGVDYEGFTDERLHPKTVVVGVIHDGTARAYPLPAVVDEGVVNDTVGRKPVVVAVDGTDQLYAYDRRIDDETFEFADAGFDNIAGGGSTWSLATGRATDGPHKGATLAPAATRSPMFWFAWVDLYPDTAIYG